TGKHMQSDTYSSIAIGLGLILVKVSGLLILDSILALAISAFIIYTGYNIIRRSLAGIMDEADVALLEELVEVLESNRRENWIDLHNIRIIKYGSTLHMDSHLTVPWYFNVVEAHNEIDLLGNLVKER